MRTMTSEWESHVDSQDIRVKESTAAAPGTTTHEAQLPQTDGGTMPFQAGAPLPADELRWKFSRSGGPGGQNVNKVETRVELLFNPGSSRVFTPSQRKQIVERLSARLDAEGNLHIVSSTHRSQGQNRDAALVRLDAILQEALRPRRVRLATRTPRAAREARMENKRHRSVTKQARTYQGE